MRIGTRLAIDPGTTRVGVAKSDPSGEIAFGVLTLPRETAVEAICKLVNEWDVSEVIVGHPISLKGRKTASTIDAEHLGVELAKRIEVPVRLLDERLTTEQAKAALRLAGKQERSQRNIIDQAAAAGLLQHALDSEKLQGVVPGRLIDVNGLRDD